MNGLKRFSRELRRLLSERLTLLIIAGTAGGALWFCLHSTGRTSSDAYILNPAKSSALLGALFFTLLTLYQFHRDYRNHTEGIVLSCANPAAHQLRRTLALVCAAAVTALAVTLFALPLALVKTGAYFQPEAFAASWYLIFLGALVLSVLLSSGLYMLFRRAEAAFLVMAALILLSRQLEYAFDLNPSYLFLWVQTNTSGFSDLVGNSFQTDMIVWNRLFCLLSAIAVWLLGLCALRRYGRGLPGSLLISLHRVLLPTLLAVSVALSCMSFISEPVFDNSAPRNFQADYDSGTGMVASFSSVEKETYPLTMTGKTADLDVDTKSRTVSGSATYTLKNATGAPQVLSLKANTGYTLEDVTVNGAAAEAVREKEEMENCAAWDIALPADADISVALRYSGRPKNDGMILQRPDYGICGSLVWLPPAGFSPSADAEISEAFSFEGTLALDEGLTPVFLRDGADRLDTADGKTRWRVTSPTGQNASFIAADYAETTFNAGGLDVTFKYFAKQRDAVADMDAVTIMKAAIDYFTEAIGPLPYKDHLTMLELPASLSGGFASGSVSAMDETNFAEAGCLPVAMTPDSGGGGVDVLAHEIAHQWWGLATFPMQDGASAWSAEGLTCYSTYRFLKDFYGEDYAGRHFIQEWARGWKTYQNAFYIQHPEYLQKLTAGDASNVMGSFTTMRLYDIMPLQLLKAEAAAGGPEAFDRQLAELYIKHLMNPITYADFLSATGLKEEALQLA